MPLHWNVDAYSIHFDRMRIRGWVHHSPVPVVAVDAVFTAPELVVRLQSFPRESPDLVSVLGSGAARSRFDEWLEIPDDALGRDFALHFTLADGAVQRTGSVHEVTTQQDPFHACWARFVGMLQQIPEGSILEIGSRARSAVTRRQFVPKHLRYVGLDILPGPNVDVVGDAHELAKAFPRERFAAAFSVSVFEHLAMPWKAVIELNRVLAPGALVFTGTHQTWPMHEEPWDFWRFSPHSWQTLYNAATGFELVEAVAGDWASIYPNRPNAITRYLPLQPAYLGAGAIARKISDTTLDWPVPTRVATMAMYPKGELERPPEEIPGLQC